MWASFHKIVRFNTACLRSCLHCTMGDHPTHIQKKRTMMKDRVGCVRASTYNLPAEGHSYGMKTVQADEGVGTIISNWVTANPSLEKKSSKLIVYSNVLAVKHGCITATAMRQYSIDHPNIRMKEVLTNDSTRVDANHEGPFGVKTRFSEDPMGSILQGRYTDFTNEDADYPSVVSIKKVGFMPSPRPTIASQSQSIARTRQAEKDKPKHFIMKRFQNVPGTEEIAATNHRSTRRLGASGTNVLNSTNSPRQDPTSYDEEY